MIRKFDQEGDVTARRFAALLITTNNEVVFLHRDAEGAIVQNDGPIDVTVPCFVRLSARRTDEQPTTFDFQAEVSSDGTTWRIVNALTRIAIDGRCMIGLTTTAQTDGSPNTSTASAYCSFSKVEIVPAISDVSVE
jgi:hypothetical protein